MKPVSLDLSKKLHEAGIVVETHFFWDDHTEFGEGWILTSEPEMEGSFPAPLSCELAEILPKDFLLKNGTTFVLSMEWSWEEKRWWVHYVKYQDIHPDITSTYAPTLSDAMAKMLLHLKKKGLL